jgi:hypothetical protein
VDDCAAARRQWLGRGRPGPAPAARQAQIPAGAKKSLTAALERLVQLYDAWGKPDQAARWRPEREKLPKPPEPPKAK